MDKMQQTAVEEVLRAVVSALRAGVDSDTLMDRVIRKCIEVERGIEHNGDSPQLCPPPWV